MKISDMNNKQLETFTVLNQFVQSNVASTEDFRELLKQLRNSYEIKEEETKEEYKKIRQTLNEVEKVLGNIETNKIK